MPLITLFSAPKPFTDPHIAMIRKEMPDLVYDEPRLMEINADVKHKTFKAIDGRAAGN